RLIVSCDIQIHPTIQTEMFENGTLLNPVLKVWPGYRYRFTILLVVLVDVHESFGMRIRKWPQHDAVHHRENCRVGAYPKSETEDCNNCETRFRDKRSRSVDHVTTQFVEVFGRCRSYHA